MYTRKWWKEMYRAWRASSYIGPTLVYIAFASREMDCKEDFLHCQKNSLLSLNDMDIWRLILKKTSPDTAARKYSLFFSTCVLIIFIKAANMMVFQLILMQTHKSRVFLVLPYFGNDLKWDDFYYINFFLRHCWDFKICVKITSDVYRYIVKS